ncbi:uncharacterized protein BX664DRAFT_259855 [Halteromyces radiatus]|uniref:uncharacterized protein n=1 Tax=Halteromyces radiatus TaxID=101107 RepID=UPI00221E510B|nr:uncharacterized protein BX664DRAFT_259855 [Halteromyces radiatus]KAI8092540.1 hypothetical protein BX664DRAFT_259855 [Halteromyces radiatus]
MTRLLPHFWNLTQLYETLVILLMGLDIAEYPLYDSFHIKHLQDHIVEKSSSSKPIAGHVLPILMALCREGGRYRRSRIQNEGKYNNRKKIGWGSTAITIIKIQHELVCLLDELYKRRSDFKEECNRQEIVDDIVEVLFPTLGKSGAGGNDDGLLSVEEELRTKEESAHFDDFCATPSSATTYSPIDGKMMIFNDGHNNNSNVSSPMMDDGSIIKRGGTLTLMTKTSPHLNKKSGAMLTRLRSASWSQHSSITNEVTPLADLALEALLQFLVDISVASVVDPVDKNLTVLNMVLNSYPPSSLDAQMKFESYLLTYISQNLKSTLQFDSKLLGSNVILMNVAKFCQIAADAVLQGRFIDGAEQTYDLLATILETLHSLDGTGIMGRRGLSDTVATLYRAFNRMVLLKISDLEQGDMVADQIGAFLNYCIHHQKIILSPKNTDQEFLRCFCYHLYQFLSSSNQTISNDALNVWKLLLLQKPDAVANVFKIHTGGDDLLQGFSKMLEMDQESFFVWVDSRKIDLNLLFKEHVHKSWESVILQENKYSRETWKNHQARRVNKLKKVQKRQIYEAEIFAEYTTKTAVWSRSIQEVETSRFTKALQDNDGHEKFICSEWSRINSDLTRERAIWGPQLDSTSKATHSKWALDFTEGRHRMRKKIRCISDGPATLYLPKHDSSSSPPSTISEKTTPRSPLTSSAEKRLSKSGNEGKYKGYDNDETKVVETENEDDLSYEEDKNQKVLRLLDAGDMVLDVYNVSRIEGLDAREGLLLICKHHIYLVDNFFQRVDGEVVEIWDVPKHERDEYLLLLAQAAGMETEHPIGSSGDLHTCRKWANADLREVFKRRFLFRDVALELFFADGQNALITVERSERDDLFTKLVNRVTTTNDNDMKGSIFGAVDKESSTLGNAFKFTSIFGSSTLHDLTQKWERREITNFQYLMYINAIAGRSYNDLTQYPVFPWILADYTSEKLDLDKPETFRDLSKPMGAQTAERRDEFQDRYRQWGETNDPAPAFHYGTHYSSAMIVCSFLIRLEPFTQHYLKLQGGTFDHADRLFDSVGKAWESASEKNMGDVRELIPEFFCLPEFLENVNKFNFGTKQGTGETIDSVTLPPWASNDPKIFIQRHREALESDYVSQNLHHWIDLIFGYKQQGKAAIDALNVFHHVSYEGAVDLDAITDTVEKTATIGIINNFGQTPRQLFKKPHPARSPPTHDPLALGFYPLRSHLQKLIQSIYPLRGVTTCQQLYIPPDALHYIEWGYSDNSLRLYSSDSGKVNT